MRIVLQRVSEAALSIENKIHAEIKRGFLILIGIEEDDKEEDSDWLVQKINNMRIFSDEVGKMNLSIQEINGELLVVSQFTLHASTKKGNRPSFIKAAKPEKAIYLYEYFVEKLKKDSNLDVKTGVFGAHMKINLVNDGPVTIILDSKNKE